MIDIDGRSELVLPLDKIQQFLDLLGPADVPPEKLQDLYRYQSELVAHIEAQTTQAEWRDITPGQSADDHKPPA